MKTRKEIEEYGWFVVVNDDNPGVFNFAPIGLDWALDVARSMRSAKKIYRYEDCDKFEYVGGVVYGWLLTPKDNANPYYEKGENGVWELSEYYKELFEKELNK